MINIRKNTKLFIFILFSFANLLFVEAEDCSTISNKDCCHSETILESKAEANCCNDESMHDNSFTHQNSFDYCGCFHNENSPNNYLSNTFNSLEELFVTEFKYLITPSKLYPIQKIHSNHNLLDVPIFLSKQSFII